MPKAVFALNWSAAEETYILSGPHSSEARSITPESPAWFTWLAERSSFAFHGQAGSYSARLEAVQRGEGYWYAYLRTGQKVRKKYLGKTTDLTLARLEQVARDLDAERADTAMCSSGRKPRRRISQEPAARRASSPAPEAASGGTSFAPASPRPTAEGRPRKPRPRRARPKRPPGRGQLRHRGRGVGRVKAIQKNAAVADGESYRAELVENDEPR